MDLSAIKNKLKKSEDGKVVIKNFGYLSLLQLAGYFFPLITMPYLARVIGAEGFGRLAFASAIMIWVQTVADWGFNYTATRDVAQCRDDKEKVSQIFSNVIWARSILTIISGIVLFVLIFVVPYFRENAAVIMVTFLMVPGHVLFPDWFFQAIERMKYTTIFNLLLKLIFTLAVFIFVKEKDDYIWQPLLTSVGYVICGLGSLYLIIFKWEYKIYKPQIRSVITTIKNSTDVFINNLLPNLYNSFSVVLLGFFGGASANGIYDGGNKFPNIFSNLQRVLSRAFFPFLSRHSNSHGLYAKLNIAIALIGAVALYFLAPTIIHILLGDEFQASVIVMQIMSVSLIFLALDNTYATNYLIITHHERELRNITIVSSLIGLICSFPLVYYFSYVGAAFNILLCRMLIGVLSMIIAIRIKNNKIC